MGRFFQQVRQDLRTGLVADGVQGDVEPLLFQLIEQGDRLRHGQTGTAQGVHMLEDLGGGAVVDDVPTGAAIAEAVRLAKRYDGDDTGAFANGILGAFARSLTKEEN